MERALRGTTAAGLAVVAIVHVVLAPRYDLVGDAVTLGQLFRVQAALALAGAVALLLRPCRLVSALAAALALASLLAVVGTTYAALPAYGPLPRVFEPIWFPEKVLAAAAAALATLGGGALLASPRRSPRSRAPRRPDA